MSAMSVAARRFQTVVHAARSFPIEFMSSF
jgi:hypothetical protein